MVRGQKVVITRGSSTATDFDATFIEALTAANRGLDYLSVTAQADCSIRDAHDDCLIWWPDAALGGVVMRYQIVQPMGIAVSASGVVKDVQGNIKPSPPPPTPMADDAFRFIRMARTSDDLFDAYRNLFLAFESLLSDIRPRQRRPQRRWRRWLKKPRNTPPWEPEQAWFMAALDGADKLVPLATLTPPGITNHKKWINRRMYKAERSALMHSKRGENYLLPHGTADRAELIESLGRLSDYVKRLVEIHLHVRGQSSTFSSYAIEVMAKSVLPHFPLVFSDDEGPVMQDAANPINPQASVVHLRPSVPRVDPCDPEMWRIVAHCDTADISGLAAIRRVGHMDNSGRCEALSELVGPLILGVKVIRLEIARGIRHVNPTGPPRQFSS